MFAADAAIVFGAQVAAVILLDAAALKNPGFADARQAFFNVGLSKKKQKELGFNQD